MNSKRYTGQWQDYELLDAGGGKKLERWGSVITIRPEVQAYFTSGLPFSEWYAQAHWEFIPKGNQSGEWKALKPGAPETWNIRYGDLTFRLELTRFKHLGLFPEQRINWDFISEHLPDNGQFLNLFAYTGAASCVARRAGAGVLHVDSVKQLISWARENMELSGLEDIKWVHEDALKFAGRELRRGRNYSGIVMDPPAWGIGARNEKWKLEDKLDELMECAAGLIGSTGFLVLNTYSPQIGLQDLKEKSGRYFAGRGFEIFELWMTAASGKELYYGNVLRVYPGNEQMKPQFPEKA